MHTSSRPKAIVIGAGILGLAYAKSLSNRGYSVDVFERSEKATGSSIRNFGMVWPIAQPDGNMYERAMLSKSIWLDTCERAKIWNDQVGSMHLAYNDMEMDVIEAKYFKFIKK